MTDVVPQKFRKNSERRTDSNLRIINAAMELFSEKGYQRTTLIQIGQRAGVTGTLVSNRFGSKERLLRAVLAHILNRFEKSEARLSKQSEETSTVSQQLDQFVRMYLEDVAEQGARIRALYVIMGEALGALPEISEEVNRVNGVFRGEIKDYLKKGISLEEFNGELDPEIVSTLMVGLLRGISMQILFEPDRLDLAKVIHATQNSVRHMTAQ